MRSSYRQWLSLLVLIGLCSVVCSLSPLEILPSSAHPGQSPASSPTEAQLKATYAEAVRLASKDRHPAEIVTNLTAITEANTRLTWKGPAGQKKVLVATWVGSDEFDSKIGQTIPTRELWVTVVPELQRFCRTHPGGKPPALRIKQLLGLPPDYHVTKFVEVWVSPSDLFRPSPDPEITDRQAELSLEAARTRPHPPDQVHIQWFTKNRRELYPPDHPSGFPWTRLGYTYDWGNPQNPIGLSEFVVRKGASVKIHRIVPTDSYIQQ